MSSSRPKSKPIATEDIKAPARAKQPIGRPRLDPASRLRRWVFRFVAAVLIPVLFFGTVEIVLRLAGTGYPAGFLVPSETRPEYLTDNYKFAWRFFPRALARSSQPILVTQEKPPETKRMIVFGGSAAMGDPEPAFGFPRVLEVLLESRYPEQDFEVVNAAVTAVNSHVVLPIAKDCRVLDADAWIVYMGNNEVVGPFGASTVFSGRGTSLRLTRCSTALNRTKIGQFLSELRPQARSDVPESWGGMKMFLDHQVRHDDPALERVYDHFGKNLGDILDMAAGRETPVVVSTVVSNLRDCAPFTSLHGTSVPAKQLEQWQEQFQRGCAAQADGRYDQAIRAFDKAAQIDAEFAELHFRMGECFLGLGESIQARDQFRQARDFDTLRFRASSKINAIIKSEAQKRTAATTHLVDASEQFALVSPHGIAGEELLCEHVHFTFSGNYLLAKLFAEQLIDVLNLPPATAPNNEWLSLEQCADRLGLTAYHRLLFARELRVRFRSPPFDTQLNHEARDARVEAEITDLANSLTPDMARSAVERYQELLEQHPDDWILREQFSALLESTGEVEQAAEQWSEITKQLPHYSEAFFKLGSLLNQAKKRKEAEQALRIALALRPDYARALNSLGIALSHQERFDESYLQFAKAIELQPSYAEAYMNWGLVLANQGESEEALKRYHSAVQADPDYLPAHVTLGQHYSGQKQYDAAKPHYREVVRLKPNDPAAVLNLGLLYLTMEQPADAVRQLERAIELDPTSRMARQALTLARQKVVERENE